MLGYRRFAAYERYNQYAGWIGVLQERVRPGFWKVHFPAMPEAAGCDSKVPMLELPIAKEHEAHVEGTYALIYAVPRFRRWAKEALEKARHLLAKVGDLKNDAAKEQDANAREQAKAAAQACQRDAMRLMDVANEEERCSWTPITCGLSWLQPLVHDMGVQWADGYVRETDRWCSAGRRVFITPAAAAAPHLAHCKNMVGLLVNKVLPGVWSVKFGSLGIRHCCVGTQEKTGKEVYDIFYLESAVRYARMPNEPFKIGKRDVYHSKSDLLTWAYLSLAAETVAGSRPAFARGFLEKHGYPPEATQCRDVLCLLDGQGNIDAAGVPFTFGDALRYAWQTSPVCSVKEPYITEKETY